MVNVSRKIDRQRISLAVAKGDWRPGRGGKPMLQSSETQENPSHQDMFNYFPFLNMFLIETSDFFKYSKQSFTAG